MKRYGKKTISAILGLSTLVIDAMPAANADVAIPNSSSSRQILNEQEWVGNIKEVKSVSTIGKSFLNTFPYKTEYRKDLRLKSGTSKVVQEGVNAVVSSKVENEKVYEQYLKIPVNINIVDSNTFPIYKKSSYTYSHNGISLRQKATELTISTKTLLPNADNVVDEIKGQEQSKLEPMWDVDTKKEALKVKKTGGGQFVGYIDILLDTRTDDSEAKRTNYNKEMQPQIIAYNPGVNIQNPKEVTRTITFIDDAGNRIGYPIIQKVNFGKGMEIDSTGKSRPFDNTNNEEQFSEFVLPSGYSFADEFNRKKFNIARSKKVNRNSKNEELIINVVKNKIKNTDDSSYEYKKAEKNYKDNRSKDFMISRKVSNNLVRSQNRIRATSADNEKAYKNEMKAKNHLLPQTNEKSACKEIIIAEQTIGAILMFSGIKIVKND
ncbi:hypothetical protein [uncultured Lactobacillus sp.]|uniref:hypothetical protein n=1 Tax=uncultured Lactobacillus sp. TaxID=153152 RepID=UPI00261AD538|nr:hypothetical protein [uncultured Lactobacillus sp.]